MTRVLLVSLGTTQGLRVADALFAEMLSEAGSEVQAISVRLGVSNALRRGYPVNDFVEALAARRTLGAALGRRARPTAVIFSTTTAALLAPRGDLPYAVRLDSPAALNRPGFLNSPVRALERRSLAHARLVLPLGAVGAAALPRGAARSEVVPVPIEDSGDIDGPRDPELAVGYVPDPRSRGLELLLDAWAIAAPGRRRLEVFGLDAGAAHAYLHRHHRPVPAGVTFRGYVTREAFRDRLRHAHCFISAAQWEDYGQAPLEALRDGALLVSTPASGPYEALPIARQLDPNLIASDDSPGALAQAIGAAFGRGAVADGAYRHRAAERLDAYGRAAAVAVLRERVLPVLMANSAAPVVPLSRPPAGPPA